MVSLMLGENVSLFVPVKVGDSSHSNARRTTIAGHTKYAVTTEGTEASVSMTFTAPANASYFFYAPSEYPRETKFFVNGEKYGDFMANESNRIKAIGNFTSGSSFTLKMVLAGENLYLKDNENYVYYLDTNALDKAMNALAKNQFIIDSYTDTSFDGSITTNDALTTVQTSIPYDNGWKIFVDGKEVESFKTFDALIAFDIEGEGVHTLKLKYSPRVVPFGSIVSITSIAVFAGIWFFDERRKKKSKTTVAAKLTADNTPERTEK